MVIKAYSKKEMAHLYGISANTFRKWIEPLREQLGITAVQKIFTPNQVRSIVEQLGEPRTELNIS